MAHNLILGTPGNDILIGTPDDDRIIGYEGNDRINAAAGIDTAVFYGNPIGYSIDIDGKRAEVSGPDGDDKATNIEFLEWTWNGQTYSFDLSLGNNPPSAANDTATTDEDDEDGVLINLTANDADLDGTVVPSSVRLTNDPAKGSVNNNNDGTFTFYPGDDFQDLAVNKSREAVFSYTIEDDQGAESAAATVTVTINGVNDAPVAEIVSATTDEDTAIAISFHADDIDSDDDPGSLIYSITSDPVDYRLIDFETGSDRVPIGNSYQTMGLDFSNASWVEADPARTGMSGSFGAWSTSGLNEFGQADAIVIAPDRAIPSANVRGVDVGANGIRIDAYNAETGGSLIGSDEAFGTGSGSGQFSDVSIAAAGINRLEIYQPASATTDGMFIDNFAFAFPLDSEIGANNDGTFTFDPRGQFDYLSVGQETKVTFDYTATDRHNAVSNTATAKVTVTGVNDDPEVGDDTATVGEDEDDLIYGNVTVADPDASDVVELSVADATYGLFNILDDGSWSYDLDKTNATVQALNTGENLTDTITVIGDDGNGATDTGTVTITINGANEPLDLDAFMKNGGEDTNAVWFNNSDANFTNSGQMIPSESARRVALGDLDGDRDLDAFIACYGIGKPNVLVFLNDGDGHFEQPGFAYGHNNLIVSVSLGDFDDDGDLDAFTPVSTGYSLLWKNDGSGSFSIAQKFSIHANKSAVGDINNDGNLDLVLARWGFNSSKILENAGNGIFEGIGQEFDNLYTTSVALADLDNDGDLDIYFGSYYSYDDQVWINNGTGNFVVAQIFDFDNTTDAAFADFDGDGYTDLMVSSASEETKILFNAGDPEKDEDWNGFVDQGERLDISGSIALGDLEGDGDIDAILAVSDGPNEVWTNDGIGHFSKSGSLVGTNPGSFVALGDLDNDGTRVLADDGLLPYLGELVPYPAELPPSESSGTSLDLADLINVNDGAVAPSPDETEVSFAAVVETDESFLGASGLSQNDIVGTTVVSTDVLS